MAYMGMLLSSFNLKTVASALIELAGALLVLASAFLVLAKVWLVLVEAQNQTHHVLET